MRCYRLNTPMPLWSERKPTSHKLRRIRRCICAFPAKSIGIPIAFAGVRLCVDREATRDIQFEESIVKGADTRFLNQVRKAGLKIYSSDIYNFVQIRQINPTTHTWDISREEYLEQCRKVSSVRNDRLVLF